MSLTTASRTFQLLTRMLDTKTPTEAFLPPEGSKCSLPLAPVEQPLPRAAAESEGISSDHIRLFLEELERNRDLYIQDVLVLRHGKVLCAAAYGGQKLEAAKYTFSACKSVTSLAIGLLIDDGKLHLTDKIADLLGESIPSNRRRIREMTVEDLLTMRSGVVFTEAESLTEPDWVRRFVNAPILGEPGTEFRYNSLNTYILSVIVCRITGGSMLDFLRQRLFDPMGITGVLWEKCPCGYEKGGWGLHIRPEDMAKLGQLVLDGGLWQGQQLISREYLRAATTAHTSPPPELGDFDYGYQIWVGRRERSFLFNGMLGQNVLCYPDSGIIVLTNAGADTDYQESRYFRIVSRYFGGTFPDALPDDSAARSRLEQTVERLSFYSRPRIIPGPKAESFLHRDFIADDPNAAGVGLLPLALQALHNNYTFGLHSISLSLRGDTPELIYREADATYRLPIGLGRPEVTGLVFRGDHYHVAASGRFTHDEEERAVFYVRLEFMETPCVRILKLVRTEDGLLLKQEETPGLPYMMKKLSAAAELGLSKPLLLVALGSAEEEYLEYKVRRILYPCIRLKEASEQYD